MQNQRSHARTKTYFGARIEQPHGLGTMNCIVRDLSAQGARLAFHNTATVVNRFTLVVASRNRRFAARIVWRTFDAAGVVFEGELPDAAAAAGPSSVTAFEKLRASDTARRELQSRLDRLIEIG